MNKDNRTINVLFGYITQKLPEISKEIKIEEGKLEQTIQEILNDRGQKKIAMKVRRCLHDNKGVEINFILGRTLEIDFMEWSKFLDTLELLEEIVLDQSEMKTEERFRKIEERLSKIEGKIDYSQKM
ncbi:hypothetical protein D4R87_02105 [bacterium]|nr:MAG: hypothetical protein D4R87_02105 [bacterium]